MSAGGGGGETGIWVYETWGLASSGSTSYTYKDTADLHTRVMVRDANAGYHTTDTTISTRAVFTDINTELFLEQFAKKYPTYSQSSDYVTGLFARNDDDGNTVIMANTSAGHEVVIGRGWVTDADFVALMGSWGITLNSAPNYGTVVYYTDDTYTTTNTVIIPEYETVLELGGGATTTMGGLTEWTAEIAGVQIENKYIKEVSLTNLVTALPKSFLSGCAHLTKVDIAGTKATTIPNGAFSDCTNLNSNIVLPNTATSIGSYFMQNCTNFNSSITLPSQLTSIGDWFMASCSSFNKEFVLPSTLTTIGMQFLRFCSSFNQSLSLPSTLTAIGSGFFYCCDAMVSSINVGSLAATIATSTTMTLSTTKSTAKCYTTGITINGSNRAAWISRFANRTSSPYRKLINGGS